MDVYGGLSVSRFVMDVYGGLSVRRFVTDVYGDLFCLLVLQSMIVTYVGIIMNLIL